MLVRKAGRRNGIFRTVRSECLYGMLASGPRMSAISIPNGGAPHGEGRFGKGEVSADGALYVLSDLQDVHRGPSRAWRPVAHRPQRADALFRRGRHTAHARAALSRFDRR